jgi:SP family general alpha glucoside:H+ symporter-like MFS transporter
MGDAVGPNKDYGGDVHVEKAISHVDDSTALDEKAQAALYKTQAMDAETAEHDMGVVQAVRAYPMAALWAFIMSCTIVSLLALKSHNQGTLANNTFRSWRLTVSS